MLTVVGLAWFLGTFGPFLIASLAFNRTTYLYYMTIVMPGLYVAAAWLAGGSAGPAGCWRVGRLVAAAAVIALSLHSASLTQHARSAPPLPRAALAGGLSGRR